MAVFLPLLVEFNVNARTCKHDVTCFISFVPVWLFHFVSGSFTEALQKFYGCSLQQKYVFWSNNILCESHEMSFVHHKHAFMPCWIAVQYVARVPHFSASSVKICNRVFKQIVAKKCFFLNSQTAINQLYLFSVLLLQDRSQIDYSVYFH